jgi:hypothetical protein
VVPKNVRAGVKGPPELKLASTSTLTVMLVTAGPIRHSACTEPLMFVPVRACVVASSTTEPVPVNVSVTRVKMVEPKPGIEVEPVYWMLVAPFGVCHTTRSVPLGSEPPVLFIFSPNGTEVSRLIPRYRLENAPAVPEHVKVAPPASFSFPATAPEQPQPPPGAVNGPSVMTVWAAAGAAPASRPSTASIATTDPWRRRVCEVEIPPCG